MSSAARDSVEMSFTNSPEIQAIQWIWPVPILIGVLFAPESPWYASSPLLPLTSSNHISHRWLIRKGRTEDAKKALLSLTSTKMAHESFNVDQTIAMMVTTNELEKAIESGTGYWDCFKGIDLRRTEIVCVTWSIQNLCGSAFMGYSTYFYEQAGLPTVDAFDMSMAQVYLSSPLPSPFISHQPLIY
jgi:MFS transporter, SP family, general alpha glucoside:H+ symporter